MTENWITILTTIYWVSGILSMIAYFPTIRDLRKRIPSANIYTYILWFCYYIIALVYGIFVLKDKVFLMITSLDLTIILFIIFLICRLKYLNKKQKTKNIKQSDVIDISYF